MFALFPILYRIGICFWYFLHWNLTVNLMVRQTFACPTRCSWARRLATKFRSCCCGPMTKMRCLARNMSMELVQRGCYERYQEVPEAFFRQETVQVTWSNCVTCVDFWSEDAEMDCCHQRGIGLAWKIWLDKKRVICRRKSTVVETDTSCQCRWQRRLLSSNSSWQRQDVWNKMEEGKRETWTDHDRKHIQTYFKTLPTCQVWFQFGFSEWSCSRQEEAAESKRHKAAASTARRASCL